MKPRITYLPCPSGKVKSHFALRGLDTPTRDGGASWWRVYTNDRPPVLVGPPFRLPAYAQQMLAKLERDPNLGDTRAARYIDSSMMFLPDEVHNGIPHGQNVDWLRQYKRPEATYPLFHGYLVVLAVPGNEDVVLEVWRSVKPKTPKGPRIDLLDSPYTLVWKADADPD